MQPRRPLLRLTAVVLTLLTAGALVVDLARPGTSDPVRAAVATVAAPVQSTLTRWDDGRVAELTAQRDRLALEVAGLRAQLRGQDQLDDLSRSAGWDLGGKHRLLPARVVAFAPPTSPVGGRMVTIDRGEEEGVREDLTVVAAQGLVGRVVRTAAHSADVLLLGDPDAVVAVRFGARGALGSVAVAPEPGLPPRRSGQLTLTALGDSTVSVGDEVSTLGSPDDRPYAARVPLGTVTSVDPDRGRLGRTAVVTPHVDGDTLDLVAVVLDGQEP
ncbi:rod shape-determining protein MreC [Ornithinimicrobium avium]|uniref:Cell shape-determining protein MreC n=1 Tax=Ornithinimicrobium avium TaxID=2283195 RepID=A0A345NLH6_9MICO|nr:rod shape-determining protein MreC [Ornithinimicrobium avium]AXH95884.1 rod shape-determining protein MreC [Ornithinimicrobium avium]